MATAFVTGATGFVGLNLIRHLRSLKWHVTCLVSPHAPVAMLGELNVNFIYGDVTNRNTLLQAMPSATDVVFHLAVMRHVALDKEGRQSQFNETALRSVIFSCIEKRARCLVFLSDALVYGFSDSIFDETATMLNPDAKITPSAYVRSIRECESIIKRAVARGLDAITLNPGPIINPTLDLTPTITLDELLRNNTILSRMNGSRCFIDINTVILALLAVAERGRVGDNYLLGGPPIDLKAVNTLLAEMNQTLPLLKNSGSVNFARLLQNNMSKFLQNGKAETRWFSNGKQHFSSSKIQHNLAIQPPDMKQLMLAMQSLKYSE